MVRSTKTEGINKKEIPLILFKQAKSLSINKPPPSSSANSTARFSNNIFKYLGLDRV